MASSLLQVGSVTGLTESTAGLTSSPVLDTGDLRRRYNFGDRVSELAIAQDPFFRLVSKVNKKPTDDPQFKFTERRPSYHKRYAYVMGFVSNSSDEFANAELDQFGTAAAVSAAGQSVKVYMATDYKSAGNISNVSGQTGSTKIDVGASGTRPAFFLPGQLVRIPVTATAGGGATSVGYHIMKVDTVTDSLTKDSKECVALEGKIVKFETGKNELAAFVSDNFSPGGTAGDEVVADRTISSQLEPIRSYVVGSAHAQGSTYPQTWQDNPFSTGNGLTQIWKTALSMDNTTRATVLKYEGNEFARLWREKLIEHKYDIETAMIFGSQYTDASGVQYTQGALDYVVNYGNLFSWDTSKSSDEFLDDMSKFLDPRYNNANATVFFCSTDVYNWFHSLDGYFTANAKKTDLGSANSFAARADMSVGERKSAFGVDITTVYTPYGVMNISRNVHLDGTNVKIMGINMANCAYRPLVGNGINRDTAIYVGVQTLENSGIDKRIDLVQTEAGMEWQMPESHAVWTG
tara:strand:- start:1508 stop:3064 length:1557 start_codon:yes stop_codon:yes gene_type:complete